jgi:hypothetical protein
MLHKWVRIPVVLLGALASASLSCVSPVPEERPEDAFMAAFEWVQMDGERRTLLVSTLDEQGKITIYRTASLQVDRFIHLWGDDGPAVPVFFTPYTQMRFSILEAQARFNRSLSEPEAQEWAWKKTHEPSEPESAPEAAP